MWTTRRYDKSFKCAFCGIEIREAEHRGYVVEFPAGKFYFFLNIDELAKFLAKWEKSGKLSEIQGVYSVPSARSKHRDYYLEWSKERFERTLRDYKIWKEKDKIKPKLNILR